MSGVGRPRRRRTGRAVAIVAVLAVAGVATGVAASGSGLVSGIGSNDGGTKSAASTLPPATAKVTRQDLVQTQTESGVVTHGDTTAVSVRAAGTVTWLPALDAVIPRGKVLYRVDDKPVVLLYGSLPAYRALSEGSEGADVEQLERNLDALGYDGFTIDDEFTDNTAEAVEDWQDDLGMEETGAVDLGAVIYAAKPVRIDSHEVAIGDAVQPGAAVLAYTDTSPVAVAELDVSDQQIAAKGAAVQVTLPDGTNVAGKVTGTKTVVDSGDSDSERDNGDSDTETKLEVTVELQNAKALARFDQTSVELGFTASRRPNVLTVPVAALLALAEGGYGVEIVKDSSSRIVAVQTGLFAQGRVEVSGAGLTEGATVGVPT
jgi:peptidoglycan hydrolase-like protein with peptidoglycan-binding domain